MHPDPFEADFLSTAPAGQAAFQDAVSTTADMLVRDYAARKSCYGGGTPQAMEAAINAIDVCPDEGLGLDRTIALVADLVVANSVVVTDPTCVGHLHCPPLVAALAAEMVVSATNQSMDSWDQAPAATYLEQHVIAWLGRIFGLGQEADGIFTSGGTQSNFMGLLLARNLVGRRLGWNIHENGLPAQASTLRILSSEAAHFSVQQSAAILGLGSQSVVAVPTDSDKRMDCDLLARTVANLRADGLMPFVVVATAGTTDFGSIDPIDQVADFCAAENLWCHVDAAYGGALAISDRFSHLLAGIGRADSITVDFHKLFYQPISCSAFLVRQGRNFGTIGLHADYLNPEENVEEGILDLVTKSIQTTRRFDGLKPFMTLQALGRRHLAAMIEATIDLAQAAADTIAADPDLRLAARPAINALVFRFFANEIAPDRLDAINREIRRELLTQGKALLAATKLDGRVWLKFTLINPRTTIAQVREILNHVTAAGHASLTATTTQAKRVGHP